MCVVIDSVDGLRGEEGGQDVYMCVERERERETEREGGRQRDRERDRHIEREGGREEEREKRMV